MPKSSSAVSVDGDEDIGRLQIAMHDELGMRVGHGIGDLQEERKPLPHIEPGFPDELVDAAAFDVLEREVGLSGGGDPRVVESRDVRMGERREDVPLPVRRSPSAALRQ
jgi:hypothetical protein